MTPSVRLLATVGAMTDAWRKIARKRVKARRDFAGTFVSLVVVDVELDRMKRKG